MKVTQQERLCVIGGCCWVTRKLCLSRESNSQKLLGRNGIRRIVAMAPTTIPQACYCVSLFRLGAYWWPLEGNQLMRHPWDSPCDPCTSHSRLDECQRLSNHNCCGKPSVLSQWEIQKDCTPHSLRVPATMLFKMPDTILRWRFANSILKTIFLYGNPLHYMIWFPSSFCNVNFDRINSFLKEFEITNLNSPRWDVFLLCNALQDFR